MQQEKGKTYALFDESGSIVASADWAFPGSVQVDKVIVTGWDGRLYYEDDYNKVMPVHIARKKALAEIAVSYERAITAAVTMTLDNPSPNTIAMETSALLAVDPDALDTIKAAFDSVRAKAEKRIAAVTSTEAVEDIVHVLSWPM